MKLRRALAILALLAVAILPVAAAPATVTGAVTSGMITDFTTFGYVGAATINVTAAVDDFTTAYVGTSRALKMFATSTTAAAAGANAEDIILSAAYLTTDFTKYFKIDPKLALATVRFGLTSSADNSYVSGSQYAVEDVGVAATGTGWVIISDTKLVDMVTVRFAINPYSFAAVTNDWIVGAFTVQNLGFGTLSAEAFYDQTPGAAIGTGIFDLTARLAIAGDLALQFGAGMNYNLTAAVADPIAFGVSAKVTLAKVMNTIFAVGYKGTGVTPLSLLAVNFAITPDPLIDFRAAARFNLASTTALFQGADVCAQLNIGAMDLYAGYLVTSNALGNTWAPAALTNGGAYLKATVSY